MGPVNQDPVTTLVDGPDGAAATLLLAHGAGAGMDSPFMEAITAGLAQRGWRVVRFEFPFRMRQRLTGRRGAPDRMPRLLEAFRQQVGLELLATPEGGCGARTAVPVHRRQIPRRTRGQPGGG